MFYDLIVVLKKAIFSEKTAKNHFCWCQVPFNGKETSGDKNERNLFYRKCSSEYFFI